MWENSPFVNTYINMWPSGHSPRTKTKTGSGPDGLSHGKQNKQTFMQVTIKPIAFQRHKSKILAAWCLPEVPPRGDYSSERAVSMCKLNGNRVVVFGIFLVCFQGIWTFNLVLRSQLGLSGEAYQATGGSEDAVAFHSCQSTELSSITPLSTHNLWFSPIASSNIWAWKYSFQ